VKTTAEKTTDDREMTDEEMVQAILRAPDSLTLWQVKGDRQRCVAVIPIPKKIKARRK
jgi:hypothetical protein